ncbi:unnamed protein product [Onchocerca flexuosa]|uniref:Pyr_redox_2 domain-containing protein n=1 Tax=Onchocerca flexuosa TaxID=387005 RepID=A0A183H5I5_9BILA|nr:unnamed protein product [Onchocerca flexuosa]
MATVAHHISTDYGHEERKEITSDDPQQKILIGLLTIGKKDENGTWRMSEIEGSEEELSCDLCILAIGFTDSEKVRAFGEFYLF